MHPGRWAEPREPSQIISSPHEPPTYITSRRSLSFTPRSHSLRLHRGLPDGDLKLTLCVWKSIWHQASSDWSVFRLPRPERESRGWKGGGGGRRRKRSWEAMEVCGKRRRDWWPDGGDTPAALMEIPRHEVLDENAARAHSSSCRLSLVVSVISLFFIFTSQVTFHFFKILLIHSIPRPPSQPLCRWEVFLHVVFTVFPFLLLLFFQSSFHHLSALLFVLHHLFCGLHFLLETFSSYVSNVSTSLILFSFIFLNVLSFILPYLIRKQKKFDYKF